MDETLERAAAAAVVPGAIAVVGDRDRVVYQRAVGRLRVDRDEPVRADTMLWLASLAKAITSVAALQLIERRSLDLDQPVASVLPAFGELQVLEGFEGGVPRLRAPARQTTVRHLLTHTAGLAYWFANPDLLRYHDVAGVDPFAGKLADLRIPLVADPGNRWDYGISTDWLGQVVEAVSGEDLASYCAQHIFGPLAMTDATFRPAGSQLRRLMTAHARTPDGGLVPAPNRTAGIAAARATQVLPFFDERVVDAVVDFERAVYAELATGA